MTLTPGGLAGLADGFLRYTNRLAPNRSEPWSDAGTDRQPVQGDDDTERLRYFENIWIQDIRRQVETIRTTDPVPEETDNGRRDGARAITDLGRTRFRRRVRVCIRRTGRNGCLRVERVLLELEREHHVRGRRPGQFADRTGVEERAAANRGGVVGPEPGVERHKPVHVPGASAGICECECVQDPMDQRAAVWGRRTARTNASNTFSITLFDDGTGADENDDRDVERDGG